MTAGNGQKSVIPAATWAIAIPIAGLFFFAMLAFVVRDPDTPDPIRFIGPPLVAAIVGTYILLIGYVYGDARRRGMRYVAWTWLAILVPNAVGIVLYFILRDPFPVYCSKCGCAMRPNFAYCPACGGATAPGCPQCHRPTQTDWSHCAGCGVKL